MSRTKNLTIIPWQYKIMKCTRNAHEVTVSYNYSVAIYTKIKSTLCYTYTNNL